MASQVRARRWAPLKAAELLDSYSRDAHGKNLALLHPDPEHIELAPLYDTAPTALWPKLRDEAAMSSSSPVAGLVRERASELTP